MLQGILKKETEGLLMAAQYQVLRTNWVKDNIDGTAVSPLRRVCSERDKTISHMALDCKYLAQNEYR